MWRGRYRWGGRHFNKSISTSQLKLIFKIFHLTPFQLTFYGDISKSIGLKLFTFFDFTCILHLAESGAFISSAWVIRQTTRMPYFTFTRLNLYLDLHPVIGFWLLTPIENRIYREELKEFLGMNFVNPFQPESEFKVYKSCKCSQIICSRVH